MSAILAVCGDSFCAMVSDGRFVEEPIADNKPHILKDDLPKVRKVNRNVAVGFAGDTLAAVQVINALDSYDTQYLTLEKIVKILREKALTVTAQPVGVRLAPTPILPRCWSSRSSRRPPRGAAWTILPTRWTPALPRWRKATAASTPSISARWLCNWQLPSRNGWRKMLI